MSALHTKIMPTLDTTRQQAAGDVTVPGSLILLASPATVLLTLLVGWILLTVLHQPLFPREMVAAAAINTIGGVLAALPLFVRARRGAKAIAQASIVGIGIRSGTILLGLAIMVLAGWGLDRMPLVYWILACYFPLLMAETILSAWLSYKAPSA